LVPYKQQATSAESQLILQHHRSSTQPPTRTKWTMHLRFSIWLRRWIATLSLPCLAPNCQLRTDGTGLAGHTGTGSARQKVPGKEPGLPNHRVIQAGEASEAHLSFTTCSIPTKLTGAYCTLNALPHRDWPGMWRQRSWMDSIIIFDPRC
jgi:hypothetical protein